MWWIVPWQETFAVPTTWLWNSYSSGWKSELMALALAMTGHHWPSLAVTGHQPSMALSRWRLSISAWAPLSGWRALGSTAHFPQRLLAARAAGGLQRLGLQRFFLSTVSDARFCRSCGLFLKSNGFSGCRFLYFPFPDMNTRFSSDSSPHITC